MYHLKSLVEVWQQDRQQEGECLCEHFLLNPDVSGFGVCFGVSRFWWQGVPCVIFAMQGIFS